MSARDVCSVAGCDRIVIARSLCDSHYRRLRRKGQTGAAIVPTTPKGAAQSYFETSLGHIGNECLIWPFKRGANGYALIHVKGGTSPLVHRRVCEAEHGPPPSPIHQAAHLCGNGHLGCINRHHLSWKTPAENCADDRDSAGRRNANAKLRESDIAEIRSLAGTLLQREIGARFGIAQTTVSDILAGKRWALRSLIEEPTNDAR